MKFIKTGNPKLKIISILFSVILWFYVVAQMQISGADTSIVELNYYNQIAGLQVSGPKTVEVTIWGSVRDEVGKNPTAYVDLKGLTEGVYELPVQVMPVNGVLLTKVEPNEVQVTIGSANKKNMAISCDIMTQPPEGYNLQDVMITPENCVVKGTEDALQKVSRVVAQLYLGNVYELQEQKVHLMAVSEDGEAIVNGISIVPAEADATILMEEIKESKTVVLKADVVGMAAEGCQITGFNVSPNMAQIFGPHNQLKDITEINLGNISLSGQSASFSKIIPIVPSEGVTVYPSEVRVDVQIRSVNPIRILPPEEKEGSGELATLPQEDRDTAENTEKKKE